MANLGTHSQSPPSLSLFVTLFPRVNMGTTGLDNAWLDAKDQLEEILKSGGAIVATAQHAALTRGSAGLDYAIVEEQMVGVVWQ